MEIVPSVLFCFNFVCVKKRGLVMFTVITFQFIEYYHNDTTDDMDRVPTVAERARLKAFTKII